MGTRVIYPPLTGNTAVVARTIAEVLEVEPLNVRGATPESLYPFRRE